MKELAAIQELTNGEVPAPAWQVRCLKCDHAEAWDKPFRPGARGRKFIFGRCNQCKRVRFLVIEKAVPVWAAG